MNDLEQRKAEILELAQSAATSRRRRRVAVRIGATTVVLAGVAWFAWPDSNTRTPIAQNAPVEEPTIAPDPSAVTLITRRPLRHVTLINDDRLLDTLTAEGLDAGLAHVGDRTILLPQGWQLDTPTRP